MYLPKGLLIFFILCSSIFQTSAQSAININHYTKGYGQSFRWVYDITQDQMGFIWMANHTGLRRYDGFEYITYQHNENDTNSISTKTILKVSAHKDDIWALGTDSVLNKVNILNGGVTRLPLPDSITLDPSYKLVRFHGLLDDNFLILLQRNLPHSNLSSACILYYRPQDNKFESMMNFNIGQEELFHFSEIDTGHLWIWGNKSNYYLVNLEDKTHEVFSFGAKPGNHQKHSELPIDEERKIWFPNVHFQHDESSRLTSFTLPDSLEIDLIDRVSVDNKDNIWFYYDSDEVYLLETQTGKLERFIDPIFRKARRIQLMNHFFVDKDGGYWNGHFVGAVRFDAYQSLFDQYTLPKDEKYKGVIGVNCRDILELDANQLLVKDSEHKMYLLNRQNNEMIPYEFKVLNDTEGIEGSPIYSFLRDPDGSIWANGPGYLLRLNPSANTAYKIELPDEFVITEHRDQLAMNLSRIFQDSLGRIWYVDNSGLFLYDENVNKLKSIDVAHPPAEFGASFEFAQYDSSRDKIYASYREGIYSIDCTSKSSELIKVFSESEGFDIMISSALEWKNAIWLGTNKGLMKFDPLTQTRETYTRRNGLSSNIIFSILSSRNNLWLATPNGLCQFNPYTLQVDTYLEQHGLVNNEFNHWSFLKTSDGHLFFGGHQGIIGFDPEKFMESSENSSLLHFTNISTYNKQNERIRSMSRPSLLNQKLVLGPEEKNVSFRFRMTQFDNMNQIQYDYFLDGLESDWINSNGNPEVRYAHLPSGNYTFRVKARDATRLSAMNELEIPVTVQKRWYFRWWAKIIYLLMILYGLHSLYRYLLRSKLQKQEALRIKDMDQLKTQMYTNITHEFRTPLTIILGMNNSISQVAKKFKSEELFRASEMIKRNGTKLLDLINQLLDLSKIQSGKLQINYRPGNIVPYLKYLMESYQSYAEEREIELNYTAGESEILMDFDKEKLQYIVGNLVSNAIKFTPAKGKVHVRVTKNPDQSSLLIEVEDNGSGIDPDEINNIFDHFYQVDGESTRKEEGTGIGLHLVKQMVSLLKGDIQVQSALGSGTRFMVSLPIIKKSELDNTLKKQSSDNNHATLIPQVLGAKPYNGSKDKPILLIVEDNHDVAHYMNMVLQTSYDVQFAINGREGIEHAIEMVPDLIISDVMMPEKDGFELCKTLKKDERTNHIPIILLTAKANAEAKLEGLGLGADAYMSKPFDQKELLIRVKNLLNVRSIMQARFSNNDFSKIISKEDDQLDPFLIKAKDLILANLDNDNFDISYLCKALSISRAQLHRKLVALTGHSASHLIRSIRLEKAQELLLSETLNISEVAYKVGFKTQAHFSRTFSEALGLTPTEFQNQ